MIYNFDQVINRKNTISSKWDNVGPAVGNPDALPMWVADMDFYCPQPVIDAVTKRAELGLYGYPFLIPRYKQVVKDWVWKRHGWDIKEDEVIFATGAVPSIYSAVQVFTKPGENVLLQRPVYYPFTNSVVENNRVVTSNSLIYKNNTYEIDFINFESLASNPDTNLFVLCNPHNPVGRVFTYDELKKMGDICVKHKVIIFADEIHSDFIMPGYKHIPMASISEEIADITITAISPSKTFNLAGMRASCLIIKNENIRKKISKNFNDNRSALVPIFGMEAFMAAYEHCEDYIDQLIPYLQKNIDYIDTYLKANMPKIKLIKAEGTYLLWLDCKELGMSNDELDTFFIHTAAVAIDRGHWFGAEGNGFQRLNIACPKSIVEQAMAQLKGAYDLLNA